MLLNTPICDFGWKAPNFELKDYRGISYSFNDVIGEKGLLVAFICNHCPYVHAIINRLVADSKVLENIGIGVVAIMPNDFQAYQDDSPEKMAEFAQQNNMDFPYLVDETQKVGRAYDAICTPDFFGFNAEAQLQYRGRLDDAMMNDPSNRKAELLDAMTAIAKTGKGPEIQHPSMGCSIKWKK